MKKTVEICDVCGASGVRGIEPLTIGWQQQTATVAVCCRACALRALGYLLDWRRAPTPRAVEP